MSGWEDDRFMPVASMRRTTQNLIAHQLRVEILSGKLQPGERLQQAALAARMNTSTTPVREALRELAAEGLLDLDAHRGVIVHQPSDSELAEIYEIRLVLEPKFVAKTVEHITDAEIEEAQTLLDAMANELDPGVWTILNQRFHNQLAVAAHSPVLAELLGNLRHRAAPYIAATVRNSPTRRLSANDEHESLLDACRRRDRDAAAELARQHLGFTATGSSEASD